jgi:DNA mismatch repair ATPase MutS
MDESSIQAIPEDSRRARETVSYNTALRAAHQNISCLEAVSKMGSQKADIRRLTRRFLAGSMSQQEILLRDSFVEASRDLNEVLANGESRHRSVLAKMETEAAEERHKLQQEIECATRRIQSARESCERSRKTLSAVPEVSRSDLRSFDEVTEHRDPEIETDSRLKPLESDRKNPIRDLLSNFRSPTIRIRDREKR